jgi:very-short-patch-repair endonuclease
MADIFARSLRNNATSAERLLWRELRPLKLEGRHFRRQVPIAGFVADFACHYPKVVVELDGGQHGNAASYDHMRSKRLNAEGYKVLRFWNVEVFEGLEGVVDRVRHEVRLPTAYSYSHLNQSQTPTPTLPTRGRE